MIQSLSLERRSGVQDYWIFLYPVLLFSAYILATQLVFSSYTMQFWFVTSIIVLYNCIEFINLYKQDKYLYLIKPVVLGAFALFLLQFGGITNFLLLRNDGEFATLYNNNFIREPQWLSFGMGVVLGANVFYWWGYKLSVGRQLYSFYIRYFRHFWNFNINNSRLILGWVLGVVIKLIINAYGAIGHKYIKMIVDGEYVPPFIMRLKVFENTSLLFFIMLLFLYYKDRSNKFLRNIVWLAFLFDLVFAVTSGARFTILVLFLSVFFVNYIVNGKLKLYWIAILPLVLYLSMTIIKEYKDYVFSSDSSVTEQVNPVESIQKAIEFSEKNQKNIKLTEELKQAARIEVVARFNYVNDMTQMMYYKQNQGLKASDPDFINAFLTFPIFAVFPKFYFFGIEDPKYGYWATEILTGSKRTSTAISPIGFSFLAGGSALVMLVFLCLGILMKWAECLMIHLKTSVGLILFLAIMSTLVLFDSVVPGSFINLIRYSILLPPLLWVLLSANK